MLRWSIRTKILFGFIVVLLAFGGATLYGAWGVHTLGQQLRLVALGYSTLRLELQDQQTLQANLQKRLAEPDPSPRFYAAVAADRKLRRLRLAGARPRVAELRRSLPPADARLLDRIDSDLATLQRIYAAADGDGEEAGVFAGQPARQLEEQAALLLQQMSSRLTNKVVEVVGAGERYEARTVWMTLFLALCATACGALVMLLVQATLRPLRKLCESAKEVARGNYRERVAADSPDEVGALGREFNAMAAALAEREQRLRRTEQLAAVGKMAAQITHEIRNPLTSIGLNAELLADELTGDDGESRALARAIVKEVDRLTDITEQYLRFARLPAPRFEHADVNALLRSLLAFMDEELRARGVRVQVALAAELPEAMIDENQLRQALLNLIRNAAEAMAEVPPPARLLSVRSRCVAPDGAPTVHGRAVRPPEGEPAAAGAVPPRAMAIDIIDQGPGIPEPLQRQIFDPFFTTKKGGTGLGLALALEVVMRHGGSLAVHSPAGDGQLGGTCFTVELPTP